MAFLENSVRMSALKKAASRHGASRAGAAKKFYSATASGSLSSKKASRRVSKRAGSRDRVPDEQPRLFAEVMRATARSLAT